jgi:hypothetical protein
VAAAEKVAILALIQVVQVYLVLLAVVDIWVDTKCQILIAEINLLNLAVIVVVMAQMVEQVEVAVVLVVTQRKKHHVQQLEVHLFTDWAQVETQ